MQLEQLRANAAARFSQHFKVSHTQKSPSQEGAFFVQPFGQINATEKPGDDPTEEQKKRKQRHRCLPQPPLGQEDEDSLYRQQADSEAGPVLLFLLHWTGIKAEPGLVAVNAPDPRQLYSGQIQTAC